MAVLYPQKPTGGVCRDLRFVRKVRTQLPRKALQPSGRRSERLVPPARLSESKILKLMRRTALAQEVKKFDTFAQASLHHLRAANHFADNRDDFTGAQI